MSELLTEVELTRLARELDVPEEDLAFLTVLSTADLRAVRQTVSDAMFTRYESRVRPIAALAKLLPAPITARIAQFALGPLLSGRIASVMNPGEAARLATRLPGTFVADLAVYLDPHRVEPILRRMPDELVVSVGRLLLQRGEHLTLGRFVSVVSADIALGVVDGASPQDLLRVALFTEKPTALADIIGRLPDEVLSEVVRSAAEEGHQREGVTLLTALPAASRSRLLGCLGDLSPQTLSSFVSAVREYDAWPAVLPGVADLPRTLLRTLVNLPEFLDPVLVGHVVEHARDLDLATTLARVLLAFDAAHLQTLRSVKQLQDEEFAQWMRTTADIAPQLVDAVLAKLSAG